MTDERLKSHKCPHCGKKLDKFVNSCPECFSKIRVNNKNNILKVVRVIGFTVGLVLSIHLIAFLLVFVQMASSGIHLKAKAYFSAASVISTVEVIPLQEYFGMDCAASKPFKELRELFYEKGVASLPKNDGEQYIWWFTIYYPEFEKLPEKEVIKYRNAVNLNLRAYEKTKKKVYNTLQLKNKIYYYDLNKLPKLKKWVNRLYLQLEPLAKSNIKDKNIREKRLNCFNALALSFYNNNNLLSITDYRRNNKRRPGFINSEKEIEVYKNLYYQYKELTTNCFDNEKESFNYFFEETNRHMYHYVLLLGLSKTILRNYENYKKEITCDNEFLISYGKNFGILNGYRKIPLSKSDAMSLVWILGIDKTLDGKWARLCPDNPDMAIYNKYVINY